MPGLHCWGWRMEGGWRVGFWLDLGWGDSIMLGIWLGWFAWRVGIDWP